MPKLKTRKAASKRYKITGTGKIMRRKSGISHLQEHRSAKSQRDNAGVTEVFKGEQRKIKQMMPYI